MEKVVVTNCCECGLPFRAIGDGNFVTYPHCGAELSFTPVSNNRFPNRNKTQYASEPDNPLYYDEDLEGAPGFYGGE